MTGAESLVHAYFGDDGISLPKYVYADASYHLFGVYSNLISSSSPYFFPNLPLHQGVVYRIRRILVRYGTDTGARKYCGQLLCTLYNPVEPFLVTDTGQIRDRNEIAPAVTQTNKQTNTKLKLCGPWLAPDVTEVTSSA